MTRQPTMEQLCAAIQQTVRAVPARFTLTATDPITGHAIEEIDLTPAEARHLLGRLISAEVERERRQTNAMSDRLQERRASS